jgi:hypothetical protein
MVAKSWLSIRKSLVLTCVNLITAQVKEPKGENFSQVCKKEEAWVNN